MAYTRTTWLSGETPLSADNMNNIEEGISEALEVIHGLTNFFFPVGSYYETSDTSFDPNEEWTGTWELEAEGLVHIGAGSTYSVGDTGGETQHTLTEAEMPRHQHVVPRHRHSMGQNWSSGSGGVNAYMTAGNRANTEHFTSWQEATPTGFMGGSDPHNIMQPYIVVNRWHRTA